MATLRFTTAGESHGPGLVAVRRGPARGSRAGAGGHRPRPGPPPARARARRPDEDRVRPRDGLGRHPPRPHARQPGRAADREPRPRELGRAHEPVAGRGGRSRRSTCRARATPTSPACSSTATRDVRNVLERASARETAARVAAGALGEGVPARARHDRPQPRPADRRACARPARETSRPQDFEGVDESPVRCLDAGREHGDGGRDRPRPQGEREPRRGLRGARLRRPARARLAHRLGRAPRRPARVRADVDPRDEGRRDRRRLRPRRRASGSQAHDEIFWNEERGYVRETNRAGGHRGRHDDRRPGRRARGDEAAADPHEAAALGRHRDQGAGRGAARAHRLLHGAGRRRRRRGDGGARAGARRAREVRRRRACEDVLAAVDAYRERIGWRR